ncbi:hypothetical protein niasHT_005541 [Heterodera trifolii]|uniref:C2H2-type domain-containing protein n=1 Tax=Heterodera trifolii TaxID=157864 RepID=A0ABD2LSX0_9BILA
MTIAINDIMKISGNWQCKLCVGWSERETTSLEHATPHRRQKKQPLKQQQKIERKQPEKPTQGPNNVFDHHWAECDCVGFYPLVELLQRQKYTTTTRKRESGSKNNGKDKAGQKLPGHAEKEPSVSPDEAPKETEDSEQMESGIVKEKQQKSTASEPSQEGETAQQQNGGENSAEVMRRC